MRSMRARVSLRTRCTAASAVKPVMQRLVEPPPPAVIVGEHAERLQHLAMLAGARHVAALHHVVDRAGEILDGLAEPAPLELDVLGDQARDHDARLVQHDMAERHAFRDGQAGEPRREFAAGLGADLVAHEPARGDHLGEHHGGGLQRLDLLVAILTLGAVLHREHADCVAAAQDRHADEGVIDLLAGLRPVGEGRMVLGVGELHRLGLLRDQADQSLARLQMGVVDRLGIEAFGGEQLERAVAAAADRASTPRRPCSRRSAPPPCRDAPARSRARPSPRASGAAIVSGRQQRQASLIVLAGRRSGEPGIVSKLKAAPGL